MISRTIFRSVGHTGWAAPGCRRVTSVGSKAAASASSASAPWPRSERQLTGAPITVVPAGTTPRFMSTLPDSSVASSSMRAP